MPPGVKEMACFEIPLVPFHSTNCTPSSRWVALAHRLVAMLTGQVRLPSAVVRFRSGERSGRRGMVPDERRSDLSLLDSESCFRLARRDRL